MTPVAESTVESAALSWLSDLGYSVLHGPAIAPGEPAAERSDYSQVILESRLRSAIDRLNPGLPAEAQEEAFRVYLEGAPWSSGAVADVYGVDADADLDRIVRRLVRGPDAPLYLGCPPASIRVIRLTWDSRA